MSRLMLAAALLVIGAPTAVAAQTPGDVPLIDSAVVHPCPAAERAASTGRVYQAATVPISLRLPRGWRRDTVIRSPDWSAESWSGPGARHLRLTVLSDSLARAEGLVHRYYTDRFLTPTGDSVIVACTHCGSGYVARCLVRADDPHMLIAYVPFRAALAPSSDRWVRTWAGSSTTPWIFLALETPDTADKHRARAALLSAALSR